MCGLDGELPVKTVGQGDALVVQRLGLHTSTAAGTGSSLVGELGSCKLQGLAKKSQKHS